MKKLLLLKVFVKNLYRFHPRYFYLLKKNITQGREVQISNRNIFIITSCINIHDNLDYPIHNHSHAVTERLSEALIGLKSVREHYADSYIIFLESSKISNVDEKKIEVFIDEYYNLSEKKSIKIARKHFNKGVPQFTALINFLETNKNRYKADIFHFLGARYCLTENITDNKKINCGASFLYYPDCNNVSTRYFFVSKLPMSEIIVSFRKTLYCAIAGASVEDYIDYFFRKNPPLEKLGIKGLVNGAKMINE